MKVFNVDEMMWFAGESEEEVWKFAKDNEYVDCPAAEVEIIKLTEKDLDTLKFVSADDDDFEGEITFRERLDFLIEQGEKFPCFFANSEY